jgi:sterol desaturase/sphingolipid hydroxylase (fatty acid hydroxylase superfamily)
MRMMTTTRVQATGWSRRWVGRSYLAILAAALTAAVLVLRSDVQPAVGTGLLVLGFSLLIWGLERGFPHRQDWQPNRRIFGLDLLHTLVSSQGVAPLVRAGLVAAAASLGSVAGERGLGIWPHHWPFVVQLLIAIPIADFGVYWAHRLMHRTHLGWRIHAVHHTPTRLYFMASARTHPLNAVVAVSCQFGALLALGIGAQALSLWAVFLAVNGLLQHANIDFQPGTLSRILATCDVHRAHHSLDNSRCNYGNMTMIWDQIFGTYFKPPQRAADVGAAGYDIPEGYLAHLTVPFALRRFEASEDSDG